MRSPLPALIRGPLIVLFVFLVFVLLEETHRSILHLARASLAPWRLDWDRDFSALLVDRLCYALVLTLPAYLLFRRWLAPAVDFGARSLPDDWVRPADPDRSLETVACRKPWWRRGLATGALAGALLFAFVAGLHALLVYANLRSPSENGHAALARALLSSWQTVVLHLFFTAFVTACLEELFFRASLQAFLQMQGLSPAVAIGVPAVLFALVHPLNVGAVLLAIGLVFGFLFWRYGPGSAILAHTVYNALLLVAGSLAQE
jgi:membrane protease YdiL (CAAX protease family)